MAHASRVEKCKLALKKARKAKNAKKLILNKLTDEEYIETMNKRYEQTLDEKLRISLWDLEHNQYPIIKYPYFISLIDEKLKEDLSEEERFKWKKIRGRLE